MVKQQNIFSLITIYTLYETRLEIEYALLHKKSSLPSLLFYGKKDYYLCFYQEGRNNISMSKKGMLGKIC